MEPIWLLTKKKGEIPENRPLAIVLLLQIRQPHSLRVLAVPAACFAPAALLAAAPAFPTRAPILPRHSDPRLVPPG